MERESKNPIACYIIGDAMITALGETTSENLRAIKEYQSGIQLDGSGDFLSRPIQVARIKQTVYDSFARYDSLEFTKAETLIVSVIEDLILQYQVDLQSFDTGLILATTKGNIDQLTLSDAIPTQTWLPALGLKIEQYFKTTNRIKIISNACISGVSALIVGKRLIQNSTYKQVVVVGCDVLSPFIASGFSSFRSISPTQCKPYDESRNGLNLGEACGALLLSATPSADAIILSGGAITNDANHISGPSRTGYELHLAMDKAMNEANILAKDVSFLDLHGTATVFNDEMESKAVSLSELAEVPVQSLKPYFGHTLGASGIIETIISAHELKDGICWATLGFEKTGTSVPLRVSNLHQPLDMMHCVKTASGFGGCNAAIVLSLPEFQKPSESSEPITVSRLRSVLVEDSKIFVDSGLVFESAEKDFPTFIRQANKNFGFVNQKFYKMDDLCKLGYIASSYLLEGIDFDSEKTGIILSNKSSSLDTDHKHAKLLFKEGESGVSPTVFVYTLANVVLGELCIRHKIKGENTFFITNSYEEADLIDYSTSVMRSDNLDYCIMGWCELFEDNYKAEFKLLKKI
ncbi:beta-ketoacyl synthase N-terminal-like domain-containing protein [Bacteroides propionicifaciens]|uniref:beta-ketoacyl synthase N-terminal-like domain-containing protein n=1 Tax=Bacteroides propionicifaciens TaxID=392838 RepID=UPI000375FA7B|nr:beta-ketoacyl synthase N-terminal-like domain-containing protein [Bacteroides propionicifaciens]